MSSASLLRGKVTCLQTGKPVGELGPHQASLMSFRDGMSGSSPQSPKGESPGPEEGRDRCQPTLSTLVWGWQAPASRVCPHSWWSGRHAVFGSHCPGLLPWGIVNPWDICRAGRSPGGSWLMPGRQQQELELRCGLLAQGLSLGLSQAGSLWCHLAGCPKAHANTHVPTHVLLMPSKW